MTRRTHRLLVPLLTVVLVVAASLSAPPGAAAATAEVSGTITGTPYGGDLGPLDGATVEVFADGSYGSPVATTTTDASGVYSVAGLAPGDYKLRASLPDFKTAWYYGFSNPGDAPSLALADDAPVTGIDWTLADATNEISGTVTGTPYGAGQDALADATVGLYLAGTYGSPVATTTTDASGAYSFAGLAPGDYKLRATKTDFKTTWYYGFNNPDDAASLPVAEGTHYTGTDWNLADATNEISGTITGTPYDAGQDALAGATVSLYLAGTYGSPVATTATNAAGTYSFTGLPPGDYKLRATKTNFKTTWYYGFNNPDDAPSLPVAEGTHYTGTDWNLADATNEISGTITGTPYGGDLGPLNNATVSLYLAGTYGSPVATTATNAAGTYSFTGLPPGDYKLRATKTSFKTTWYYGFNNPDDAPSLPVGEGTHYTGTDWNLADATNEISGTITGTPYGGDLGPLNNATVSLYLAGSYGSPVATTATNAAGTYSFTGLPPGDYKLRATKTNFKTTWYYGFNNPDDAPSLPVGEGTHSTGTDWNLDDATTSIEGTVGGYPYPDYQGVALDGATVALFSADSTGSPVQSTSTSVTGAYRFDGLAPGSYKLRVTKVGWKTQWYYYASSAADAYTLTIEPGYHLTGIDIWLEDASIGIKGRVRGTPQGATEPVALAGASVSLYAPGNTTDPVATTAAGPGGTYEFTAVPAGTYLLKATADGYQTQWYSYATSAADAYPLSLDAGDHVDIDFDLADASTLVAGTTYATTYPSGTLAALSGVVVQVYPSDATGGSPVATATSGANGTYQVVDLAPGTYRIRFVPPAGAPYGAIWYGGASDAALSTPLEITPGTHYDGIDAYLTDTSTSIAGTVRHGSGGSPIAGVTVDLFTVSDTEHPVTSTTSGADGSYQLTGIATGNHLVRFSGEGYATQWFYGATTATDASTISVEPGTHATDIDAYLTAPGFEWTQTSDPTIAGVPAAGETLTAQPGTWTPTPDSFEFQWSLDGTDVAGETGQTYLVPASAKGKQVTVTVSGIRSGFPKLPHTSAPLTIPSWTVAGISPATDLPSGTISVQSVNADPAGIAISSTPLLSFPRAGSDFLVLSSGNANQAATPGSPGTFISTSLNGPKGVDGVDLTQLTLSVSPPSGQSCLLFDFVFGSEEYPEYVGSSFNDLFTVETPSSDITKSGGSIQAPNNYAKDLQGNLISINTVVGLAAPGNSVLDGVTPVLVASVPLVAGQPNPVVLSIQDLGDNIYDSAVFVDRFRFGSGAECTDTVEPYEPISGSTPTITGGDSVGSTLTAVPGDWTPAPVSFGYQWLVDGAPVAGAIGETFAVTSEFADHTISVKVTGSKPGYQSVSKTSAGLFIPSGPPVSGPTPTVTGTPALGQTLTAHAGTWSPSGTALSYSWSADGTPIPGASGTELVLGAAQVGKAITVTVTGSKEGYSSASRTSDPTAVVAPGTFSPGTVTVLGTAKVGSELTAGTGTWTPTPDGFTYQWRANGSAIDGATGPVYVPVPGDIGKTISVTATASKNGYTPSSATSAATSAVTPGTLVPVTPTITGTAKVGETLTLTTGTWGPAPVGLTFQWNADGTPIADATGTSYVPAPGQVGALITVTVTGTKTGYTTASRTSAATAAVVPGTLMTSVPAISGTAKVGETLAVSAGAWGPAPVDLTYQWKADGTPITGATGTSLALSAAQVGAVITVVVTGTKTGYSTATETSAPSDAVAPGTLSSAVPAITGLPKVGEPLTVDAGTWGPSPVALTYQWRADGNPISGATGTTFTPTPGLVGAAVTVTVTGTKTGYTTADQTAPAVGPVVPGTLSTVVPTISGTAKVGHTLSVAAGTWGPAPVDLTYQWRADGTPLTGATGTTFEPTPAEIGAVITVTVTGTKTGYDTASETSGPTLAVAPGTLTTATPTITGTAKVGQTLTAATDAWGPAPVALTYQWKADGTPITGATGTSLDLTPDLVAKTITVTVTGTRTGYTTASQTSAPTTAVAPGTLTTATPTITGTAKVGQTLTAATDAWGPAPVALTYQWKADGTPITGATGTSLDLTPDLVAKTITVTVTGTRTGYDTASRTSDATGAVAPGTLTTTTPVITGTAKVGETLTATTAPWGPGTVDLTYQWKADGTPITGATGTTLVPTAAQVGAPITVTVTGSRAGYASDSTTSAPTTAVLASTFTQTPTPTIAGTAQVGEMLTANPGTWQPSGATFTYEWRANGVAIAGATARTLTVPANTVGKRITVSVTGAKDGLTPASVTSAQTAKVIRGEIDGEQPRIRGTAKVGKKLTADLGEWDPVGVELTIQWKADGTVISGATKKTLTLTKAVRGKRITVTVTGTKAGYDSLSLTSKKTAAIQ